MTYADGLRAATPTLETAASLIDGLLCKYTYTNLSSVINTTSTSIVDMTGTGTSVTVASGEIVVLLGLCSWSHGTLGGQMSLYIARGGSTLTNGVASTTYVSSTAGYTNSMPIFAIDAPSAGTYSYTLQWACVSGTLYSAHQRLAAIVLQNT